MIGKILGKRYELVEKIGEGGMGLVFKAKCHLLNRYVAVKILKPELTGDEDFINKFKKESLSSASLSHPNIVNIYDVGVEDGIYYIVMEYVKGKTLKDLIKESAPLMYYEIINICRQICLALEHAHNNNIIHRDIKPQNILITHDGIVKVADFGIARVSNSATLTNTGNVIGSVYYISPEQARGGYTDEKTDIYSLGTVIYEMATGQVPFMAESPVVIALKHIQEDVTRPSEINTDIPVALEDIILKALQKNPAARYESAAALIKDLDRASSNPDIHLQQKHNNPKDMTRAIPVVKDAYLKDTRKEKHPAKKRINKGWIAAVVILLTMITVSWLLIYSAGLKSKDVTIPGIYGLSEDNAKKLLQSKGLEMEVASRIPKNDVPQGTVFKSYPEPGTSVKQNYVVKVNVSAGLEKVNMPDLIGYSLTDALLKLDEFGLGKANVIEINNNQVEKDRVIKQKPDVNTQVDKGSAVELQVSKGPELKVVPVPSLEGILFENVEKTLTDAKLKLGDYKYDTNPNKPNNVVLSQNVAEKVQVPEGTAIDVVVNRTVSATN